MSEDDEATATGESQDDAQDTEEAAEAQPSEDGSASSDDPLEALRERIDQARRGSESVSRESASDPSMHVAHEDEHQAEEEEAEEAAEAQHEGYEEEEQKPEEGSRHSP